MRHVVVYRGTVPRKNVLNQTFDPGVPTPVDLNQFNKLDPTEFPEWHVGEPAAKGRPVLIKIMHYSRMVFWSRQFVEIVRQRFPTCPIVIYGPLPGFERVYDGIDDVSFLYNPSHTELKKIDPYRTFDTTSGDQARMSRSPISLVSASYGAQTAIAFNVTYGYRGWMDDIPPPYPPVKEGGDYVLVVEYGPSRERSWEDLRTEIITRLEAEGVPYRKIVTGTPESFARDWETISKSAYCIFCGESDLVYAAALQGKRGAFASRADRAGWLLRGQLKGSGFHGHFIEIQDGNPVTITANRVVNRAREAMGMGAGDGAELPEESPRVYLNPHTGGITGDASAHDLGRDRARKGRKSRKNRIRQS